MAVNQGLCGRSVAVNQGLCGHSVAVNQGLCGRSVAFNQGICGRESGTDNHICRVCIGLGLHVRAVRGRHGKGRRRIEIGSGRPFSHCVGRVGHMPGRKKRYNTIQYNTIQYNTIQYKRTTQFVPRGKFICC